MNLKRTAQEHAQRILSGAVKHSGSKLEAYQDSFEGLNTALRMFTKLRGLPAARTRFSPTQLDQHITFCAEMATKAQARICDCCRTIYSLVPLLKVLAC